MNNFLKEFKENLEEKENLKCFVIQIKNEKIKDMAFIEIISDIKNKIHYINLKDWCEPVVSGEIRGLFQPLNVF